MAMTLLPYGLKGMVYRSPMPFSRFDLDGGLLREYQECGISVVVMLVGDEEAMTQSARPLRELYLQQGMSVVQMDIRDFGAPALEDLRMHVRRVRELVSEGHNVVIHCHAGVGRTGLFAACLHREIHASDGPEAVHWVRQYIPGAVESDSQVLMVSAFFQGKNTT